MSYTLSSLLFSQVYLWSSTAEDLDFILVQSGDRARLNEKPIFYTAHFLLFGVMQGIFHIYRDDDRLLLGSVKLDNEAAAAQDDHSNWQARLQNDVPALASLAAMQSAGALLVNVILYHISAPGFFAGMTIRGAAWRMALSFFRTFYTLPKSNMVPTTLAGINGWMWLRCFWTGSMLLFLWLAGNKLFSVLLIRAPLKLGKPLTSESKDPNGSLLNGLKSRKLHIKVCCSNPSPGENCVADCCSASLCGNLRSSPRILSLDERPSTKILTGRTGRCGHKYTNCVSTLCMK